MKSKNTKKAKPQSTKPAATAPSKPSPILRLTHECLQSINRRDLQKANAIYGVALKIENVIQGLKQVCADDPAHTQYIRTAINDLESAVEEIAAGLIAWGSTRVLAKKDNDIHKAQPIDIPTGRTMLDGLAQMGLVQSIAFELEGLVAKMPARFADSYFYCADEWLDQACFNIGFDIEAMSRRIIEATGRAFIEKAA